MNLFSEDKELECFKSPIMKRISNLHSLLKLIDEKYESLDKFSSAHLEFGIHLYDSKVIVKEWIPNALKVYLIGDFNNLNEEGYELIKINEEIFQLVIDGIQISQFYNSKIKLKILTNSNKTIYRPSPWARYMVFNEDKNILEQVIYFSEENYVFNHSRPDKVDNLKIYEAHIGISSSKPEIATYSYFKTEILPRIKYLGYNAVQLIGVMEHAYYASFGYQVTNFFATSSRFGTPNDLKELIDTAHGMGLRIFLDLVHSHASTNTEDGLNQFDGSDGGFFHRGSRGCHPVWRTRLFNYSKLFHTTK